MELKVPRQFPSTDSEFLESAVSAVETSFQVVAFSNIVMSVFFAGLL